MSNSNQNNRQDNNRDSNLQDAKDTVITLQEQFADAGSAIKDTAVKVYDTITDKGSDVADAVCDTAGDANKKLTGLVKENPYIAVASALLTGWLIAKIL